MYGLLTLTLTLFGLFFSSVTLAAPAEPSITAPSTLGQTPKALFARSNDELSQPFDESVRDVEDAAILSSRDRDEPSEANTLDEPVTGTVEKPYRLYKHRSPSQRKRSIDSRGLGSSTLRNYWPSRLYEFHYTPDHGTKISTDPILAEQGVRYEIRAKGNTTIERIQSHVQSGGGWRFKDRAFATSNTTACSLEFTVRKTRYVYFTITRRRPGTTVGVVLAN